MPTDLSDLSVLAFGQSEDQPSVSAGLFFKTLSKLMKRLADSPEKLRTPRDRCRDRISHYTPKAAAEGILAAFNSVLKNKPALTT